MALFCEFGCGCKPFASETQRIGHYKEFPNGSCVEHFNTELQSENSVSEGADAALQDGLPADEEIHGPEGPVVHRRRPPPIPIDSHVLQQDNDEQLLLIDEDDDGDDAELPSAHSTEEEEERIRRRVFHVFTNGNQGRGYSLGDIDKLIKLFHEISRAADGPNKARLTFKSKDDYAKYTNKLLDIEEDGWNTVTITVSEEEVSALRGHEPVQFEFHFKKIDKWLEDEYSNPAYRRDFALNHVKRNGADGSR